MRSGALFDLPPNIQDKIMPEPMSGCWIWIGARAGKNYGVVTHDGKQRYAHTVVYTLLVGPIPEGLEPDHLCRLSCCTNPDHIEPVTHAENMRRSTAVQRMREWASAIMHCPSGHGYTPENTYVNNGKRSCRKCTARANAQYDERNREKRAAAARAYRALRSPKRNST